MRALHRGALGFFAAVAFTSIKADTARAQDTVSFPAQDHVAIRDMRAVPVNNFDARIHIHTVVGATGAASFGEVDSGGDFGPPHHHTHEQADVGLTGTFDVTVGNHIERLHPGVGVIVPADVLHALANRDQGRITAIEFHTIPRPDLVPGHPAATHPAAPSPVGLPDNHPLAVRLNTPAGAADSGATCMLRWNWVTGSVDLHPQPTPTELYAYVAQGEVRLRADGRTARVASGSLLVIPAKDSEVRVEAAGGTRAALLEFQVRP